MCILQYTPVPVVKKLSLEINQNSPQLKSIYYFFCYFTMIFLYFWGMKKFFKIKSTLHTIADHQTEFGLKERTREIQNER